MAFTVAEAPTLLEPTPSGFRALLDGLPDARTAADDGPGPLSAREHLATLRR